MKKLTKSFGWQTASIKWMLFVVAIITVSNIIAQEKQSITGKLVEKKTNQAIPFASVALLRAYDSTMIDGSMSDGNGVFNIHPAMLGNYRLRISSIGYKTETKEIALVNKGVTDAGIILMSDAPIMMNEVEVTGERVKAKSEGDKTTFYMTKRMLDVSNSGTDVLKLIPGIQLDLNQNISLEGSHNIQILVDGKERDGGFISQLNPKLIDRVEVISRSASNIDGNATGAINIILKKDRDSGIDGQVFAEIPASGSEIYLHPAFNLNWGFKKLNLFTSYKGDMTYLDLDESTNRKSWNSAGINEITSNQNVRQKDWSHRFNLGLDYFLSAHDQVNFYAFYNPFSRELDGNADLQISGRINSVWQAKKEDSDLNTGTFYSLFYKHNFMKEGRELTMEVSNYNLTAKNSTQYIPEVNENSTAIQTNTLEPKQNGISVKMNFSTPVGNKLNFSTGIKTKFQVMQDGLLSNFYYDEKIIAAYGMIAYHQAKYDVSLGLRAENSIATLRNNFSNSAFSLFPDVNYNYKLTSRQHIQLSYSRSIKRPDIYQLNPQITIDDPYTVSKGNPFLKPELHNTIFLEYSIRFKSNYVASRLFYSDATNAISNLTFLNDTNAFETQVYNMGTLHQYGVQFSGTVKFGIGTINPYLKLFELSSSGNSNAKEYGVENRNNIAFESGLSAILSFKHDISLSAMFQYASPNNNIQGNSFCDALYFLSLDKTFKQKIKIGVVSALPFCKTFVYQGSSIDGSNFSSHYTGNVNISNPFCWIKLSYQFNSGKNRTKINHESEEIDSTPKKGF
jgi:hypothetical protein